MLLDPDDPIREELRKLGITDDPASEYQISRRNKAVNYIPGKTDDQLFFVDVKNIIFIESLGHDVLIHTADAVYRSSDRLKSLDLQLTDDRFLRISNSVIVNIKAIRRIESSMFQKFTLHLSDKTKVEVTRSYYNIFKDTLGI